MPLLRGTARRGLRRPRDVAARQLVRAARARERDGALLSAARARMRALPARAARGVRERRGDLLRLRLLLVVLVDVARALAPLRRADDRPVGPRRVESRRGARVQRRLPPAVLRRAWGAGAGRRAGRQRRGGGGRQ